MYIHIVYCNNIIIIIMYTGIIRSGGSSGASVVSGVGVVSGEMGVAGTGVASSGVGVASSNSRLTTSSATVQYIHTQLMILIIPHLV